MKNFRGSLFNFETGVAILTIGLFAVAIYQSPRIAWALTLPLLASLLSAWRIRKMIVKQAKDRHFLAAVLDELPIALFCKDADRDFKFTLWNRKSEEIFGLRADQVLGKNDYDLFPRDQADFFRAKDVQALAGKALLEILEEPIDTKTKGRVFVHTLKVPVVDAKGRPQFLLGISEDITQRKKTEDALNQEKSKNMVSAKMASLGEMSGGIAHEINNPLSIIQGKASQLRLQMNKGPVSPEEIVTGLEKIESTSTRIAKIIRGLRTFTRNAEHDPFEFVLLSDLVEDTLGLCGERFRFLGIELRIKKIPVVELECRQAQICQALLNLLNNSHDAILGLSEKWIEIEVVQLPYLIQIKVTDSGPGIPAEIVDKITEPFFTTKSAGHGTGLGLSISKGLIEQHHGSLILNRTSPYTCFVIELPLTQPLAR